MQQQQHMQQQMQQQQQQQQQQRSGVAPAAALAPTRPAGAAPRALSAAVISVLSTLTRVTAAVGSSGLVALSVQRELPELPRGLQLAFEFAPDGTPRVPGGDHDFSLTAETALVRAQLLAPEPAEYIAPSWGPRARPPERPLSPLLRVDAVAEAAAQAAIDAELARMGAAAAAAAATAAAAADLPPGPLTAGLSVPAPRDRVPPRALDGVRAAVQAGVRAAAAVPTETGETRRHARGSSRRVNGFAGLHRAAAVTPARNSDAAIASATEATVAAATTVGGPIAMTDADLMQQQQQQQVHDASSAIVPDEVMAYLRGAVEQVERDWTTQRAYMEHQHTLARNDLARRPATMSSAQLHARMQQMQVEHAAEMEAMRAHFAQTRQNTIASCEREISHYRLAVRSMDPASRAEYDESLRKQVAERQRNAAAALNATQAASAGAAARFEQQNQIVQQQQQLAKRAAPAKSHKASAAAAVRAAAAAQTLVPPPRPTASPSAPAPPPPSALRLMTPTARQLGPGEAVVLGTPGTAAPVYLPAPYATLSAQGCLSHLTAAALLPWAALASLADAVDPRSEGSSANAGASAASAEADAPGKYRPLTLDALRHITWVVAGARAAMLEAAGRTGAVAASAADSAALTTPVLAPPGAPSEASDSFIMASASASFDEAALRAAELDAAAAAASAAAANTAAAEAPVAPAYVRALLPDLRSLQCFLLSLVTNVSMTVLIYDPQQLAAPARVPKPSVSTDPPSDAQLQGRAAAGKTAAGDSAGSGASMRGLSAGAAGEAKPAKPDDKDGSDGDNDDEDDWVCAVCGGGESVVGNAIMLCDGPCSLAFHQLCVKVSEVPRGDWSCQDCTAGRPSAYADGDSQRGRGGRGGRNSVSAAKAAKAGVKRGRTPGVGVSVAAAALNAAIVRWDIAANSAKQMVQRQNEFVRQHRAARTLRGPRTSADEFTWTSNCDYLSGGLTSLLPRPAGAHPLAALDTMGIAGETGAAAVPGANSTPTGNAAGANSNALVLGGTWMAPATARGSSAAATAAAAHDASLAGSTCTVPGVNGVPLPTGYVSKSEESAESAEQFWAHFEPFFAWEELFDLLPPPPTATFAALTAPLPGETAHARRRRLHAMRRSQLLMAGDASPSEDEAGMDLARSHAVAALLPRADTLLNEEEEDDAFAEAEEVAAAALAAAEKATANGRRVTSASAAAAATAARAVRASATARARANGRPGASTGRKLGMSDDDEDDGYRSAHAMVD